MCPVVKAELHNWCERNWHEAATWLYGALPERVAADWVRPDLTRSLRQWSAPFKEAPNHGLDIVLAQLDPKGFGTATVQVEADATALDLGNVEIGRPIARQLRLSNIGRRYVELTVKQPSWLKVRPATLALTPSETATLTFEANQRMSPARLNTGNIVVSAQGLSPLTVSVEGRVMIQNQNRMNSQSQRLIVAIIVSIWLFMLLLICVGTLLGQA
jgi:hypothetical protein